MLEQPGVREFAHREVEGDLVLGDVEPLAERAEVLGEQGRPLLEQRDADVAARHHLGAQLADDVAELDGEERAADASTTRLASVNIRHLAQLLGRLLPENAGEGVGDAAGDGLGELAPERHRLLDPLDPGHQLRRLDELRRSRWTRRATGRPR